jgi:cytochrome P450
MDIPAALQDPEARLDPFDWYERMRSTEPVQYDPTRDCWDVFSYEDVQHVLSDHETYLSEAHPDRENTMSNADPPLHTRLRDPVEKFFKPGEIAHLEPELRSKTMSLLDEAVASGPSDRIDAVDDLAYHLPIMTIAELLGVPPEDRDRFKDWSNTIVAAPDSVGGDWDRLEDERNRARRQLANYYIDLFEKRRADPQDDLISWILHLEEDKQLTDNQVLNLCILLLIAGNVSTTQLLTWSVYCISRRPALVDEIRGDPEAISTTVEEVLRYRSSVQRLLRVTGSQTRLGDETLDAGEHVVVWLGSANRDPEAFDRPDEFVHDRKPNSHLAFGRSIHMCLGASLARLEARVMIELLLEKFERISPVDTDYESISSTFLYGLESLPIEYDLR